MAPTNKNVVVLTCFFTDSHVQRAPMSSPSGARGALPTKKANGRGYVVQKEVCVGGKDRLKSGLTSRESLFVVSPLLTDGPHRVRRSRATPKRVLRWRLRSAERAKH